MENNNQRNNGLLSILTREGVLLKVSVHYWRGCKKLKPEDIGLERKTCPTSSSAWVTNACCPKMHWRTWRSLKAALMPWSKPIRFPSSMGWVTSCPIQSWRR